MLIFYCHRTESNERFCKATLLFYFLINLLSEQELQLFQDSLTFCKTCYLDRCCILFKDSLTFCKTCYLNLSCKLFQDPLTFCKTCYLDRNCVLFQDSLNFCKNCYLDRCCILFKDSLAFWKTCYLDRCFILFKDSLTFCKILYLKKFHIIARSSYDTSLRNHNLRCVRPRSEPGGTRWRTGGEVKGKLANGVGSQYSQAPSERGISIITKADA